MDGGLQSELARECGCENEGGGVHVARAEAGMCEILRVRIGSAEAAERTGKPCGRYVTVSREGLCGLSEGAADEVRRVLAVEIREMAERMTGKRVGRDFALLVVGLGNGEMTPDALGPGTVRQLRVTRGLAGDGMLFLGEKPCKAGSGGGGGCPRGTRDKASVCHRAAGGYGSFPGRRRGRVTPRSECRIGRRARAGDRDAYGRQHRRFAAGCVCQVGGGRYVGRGG